jgi:hypothetical protein
MLAKFHDRNDRRSRAVPYVPDHRVPQRGLYHRENSIGGARLCAPKSLYAFASPVLKTGRRTPGIECPVSSSSIGKGHRI